MKIGREVGLGPDVHIVWGPSSRKRVTAPFLAHVHCGQTVACKMPLGTEVDLSPGDIVLDEDMMGVILRVELRRYHERTF